MIGNQSVITSPSVEAKRSFSREVNKLRRNQQILTILVLLFICMSFWVVISLVSSQQNTKISPEINKLAIPLTPTLDTSVLDSIDTKKTYTAEELADFPIFVIFNDTQSQTEKIVPIGTAVLSTSQTSVTVRAATTSSQLQTVLATPTPAPTVEPTPEPTPIPSASPTLTP